MSTNVDTVRAGEVVAFVGQMTFVGRHSAIVVIYPPMKIIYLYIQVLTCIERVSRGCKKGRGRVLRKFCPTKLHAILGRLREKGSSCMP
jgi:hypothetical protein